MYHDASRVSPRIEVRRHGLTWRHLATALLLLVTLPVFAGAALVCLPVLALGAAGQGLRQVWALRPAAPLHTARSANAR